MNVLVVKPTALGDVAQALLVVPQLKAAKGCTSLHWLVDEDYAPLVRLCGEVDRVITFPRRRWRHSWCPLEMLDWFRGLAKGDYDLTVDLQGLARSGLMTRMTHAGRRVGLASAREGARLAYTEVVRDRQVHAVDRYAHLISHCTGVPVSPRTLKRFEPPPAPAGLPEKPFTVLHPYSQRLDKLWPWQRYEELARALPQEVFVLVGQGPPFPVLAENVVDFRNRTDVADLIAILGRARTVVSTDSGPIHIASALGVPVVAIFGATSPERTGPRGERVRVLDRSPGVGHYGHRRVLNGVEAAERMASIRVEEVVAAWSDLTQP